MPRTGRPPKNQQDCDTFAHNLNKIMTEQEITAKELAIKLNTPPANISRWRNAKVYPSTPLQIKIAKELDTSVEELNA